MKTAFARLAFACWAWFAAGSAIAADFYPVTRIFIPEGYTLLAVLRPQQGRPECEKAVQRFADSIVKGCSGCRVERSSCEPEPSGIERSLARGEPIAGSVVETDHLRMLVTGPPAVARAACEQIAASSVRAGVKSARCRNP